MSGDYLLLTAIQWEGAFSPLPLSQGLSVPPGRQQEGLPSRGAFLLPREEPKAERALEWILGSLRAGIAFLISLSFFISSTNIF